MNARQTSFTNELTALLNRYSKENESNTPDFILAQYIEASLTAFTQASRERERWYGKGLTIAGVVDAVVQNEGA